MGERAVRVASALNAAFDAAASRPMTLETRDSPPSVAVSGGSVLVTATAEDAAGYGRGPDPPMKGQRTTPRALAGFWTALLQDQLTLFIQHQRPSRVLEMSPRGKALVDLYAEGELQLDELVSGKIGLEELPEAFDGTLTTSYDDPTLTIRLVPGQETSNGVV